MVLESVVTVDAAVSLEVVASLTEGREMDRAANCDDSDSFNSNCDLVTFEPTIDSLTMDNIIMFLDLNIGEAMSPEMYRRKSVKEVLAVGTRGKFVGVAERVVS